MVEMRIIGAEKKETWYLRGLSKLDFILIPWQFNEKSSSAPIPFIYFMVKYSFRICLIWIAGDEGSEMIDYILFSVQASGTTRMLAKTL